MRKKKPEKASNRGKHHLYDPEKHIPLLKEVFSKGEGQTAFCAEAGIDQDTFTNWKKKHSDFKQAYKEYICLAARIWEKKPDDLIAQGRPFNFQYWHLMMRNMGLLQALMPNKKQKDIDAKLEAAWKSLKSRKIMPQEYNSIVTGVITQLKAKEIELKTRELELKQKELEMQTKPSIDLSGVTKEVMTEALSAFMAVKAGKKVKILEEGAK